MYAYPYINCVMMHYIFVFLCCIYYFLVVLHEIQFRRTFELNHGYINIFFVCKAFQIRGLILPNLLVKTLERSLLI